MQRRDLGSKVMTVLISCADRDRKTALSLERFLKGQALPAKVAATPDISAMTRETGPIVMLWSRHLYGAGQTGNAAKALIDNEKSLSRLILVNLDGSDLPKTVLNHQVVDARSVGLRQSRAWRMVTSLARKLPVVKSGEADVVVADPMPLVVDAADSIGLKPASIVSDASAEPGAISPTVPWVVLGVLIAGLSAATWVLAGQNLMAAIAGG